MNPIVQVGFMVGAEAIVDGRKALPRIDFIGRHGQVVRDISECRKCDGESRLAGVGAVEIALEVIWVSHIVHDVKNPVIGTVVGKGPVGG